MRSVTEPHSRQTVARFSCENDAIARTANADMDRLGPPISDAIQTSDGAWLVISSIHLPLSPANIHILVRPRRSQEEPRSSFLPHETLNALLTRLTVRSQQATLEDSGLRIGECGRRVRSRVRPTCRRNNRTSASGVAA